MEVPEVGAQAEVSESDSESESPTRADVKDPNTARANSSMCNLGGSSTSLVNISIILLITSIKV